METLLVFLAVVLLGTYGIWTANKTNQKELGAISSVSVFFGTMGLIAEIILTII
jgi:hypothetical protein